MDFSPLPVLYGRHGFNQTTFAAAISKSQGFVSQVENNKKNVTSETLSKMAEVVGMTVGQFATALESIKAELENGAITQSA